MRATKRSLCRISAALLLALVVGLAPVACSTADSDRCAGIDCGEDGVCMVVGGAPRCDCALGFVQLGSQCVLIPDGGVGWADSMR